MYAKLPVDLLLSNATVVMMMVTVMLVSTVDAKITSSPPSPSSPSSSAVKGHKILLMPSIHGGHVNFFSVAGAILKRDGYRVDALITKVGEGRMMG